jgi:hypothetical protein
MENNVGGSQKEGKLPVKLSVGTENLTDDRPSESGLRAPIKMIDGRPWSPNIATSD